MRDGNPFRLTSRVKGIDDIAQGYRINIDLRAGLVLDRERFILLVELDQEYEALSIQDETRPQVYVDPVSLCYIIYTFDATRRPKGVAVSHANIVNFLRVATRSTV